MLHRRAVLGPAARSRSRLAVSARAAVGAAGPASRRDGVAGDARRPARAEARAGRDRAAGERRPLSFRPAGSRQGRFRVVPRLPRAGTLDALGAGRRQRRSRCARVSVRPLPPPTSPLPGAPARSASAAARRSVPAVRARARLRARPGSPARRSSAVERTHRRASRRAHPRRSQPGRSRPARARCGRWPATGRRRPHLTRRRTGSPRSRSRSTDGVVPLGRRPAASGSATTRQLADPDRPRHEPRVSARLPVGDGPPGSPSTARTSGC